MNKLAPETLRQVADRGFIIEPKQRMIGDELGDITCDFLRQGAAAWEADIAQREKLERAMSAIECLECGHDLLHCTCLGGLCFEEKP